jgi:hypothetical protein
MANETQQALRHLRRSHHRYITAKDRSAGIIARDNALLDSYGDLDIHGFSITNLRLIKPPAGQFLTLDGNTLVSGDINISGSFAVGGSVTLSGPVILTGLLQALGGLVVQTSLSIQTTTNFNDNPLQNVGAVSGTGGVLDVIGGLSVSGTTDLLGGLNMHNEPIFNIGSLAPQAGALNILSGVSLGGTLDLNGFGITDATTITPQAGLLTVNGNQNLTGNLVVGGTLTTSGAASFANAVTFNGLVSFTSSPVNFGNAALTNIGSLTPSAGLLQILSGLSLGGILDMQGFNIANVSTITPLGPTVTVNGSLTVNGSQLVTGALTSTGTLVASSNAIFNGSTQFLGPTNFTGQALLGIGSLSPVPAGTITVNGNVLFAAGAAIGGSPLTTTSNLDVNSHSLLNVAGISTPAAGTLTLSGTNLNVTTTTSTFSSFIFQDGNQAPGYLLQTVLGDGTARWVPPSGIAFIMGSLAFSGSYNIPFGVVGTPVEIAVGGIGTLLNVGFTSPGDAGRLHCAFGLGVQTRVQITMTVTYSSVFAGVQSIVFTPVITGIAVAGVQAANVFTGPMVGYASTTLTFTAQLFNLDDISLYCTNNTSLDIVTVHSMQISAR